MKKCDVCGGILENEYTLPGTSESITVKCMCKCQEAAAEAEANRIRNIQRSIRINDNRFNGFKDAKTKNVYFRNDDQRNPNLTAQCKNYVALFTEKLIDGRGMLFYGPTGSGKSFFANCIANELTDLGFSCMTTSLSRLADSISFDNRDEKLNRLRDYKLLVLDDLGTERNTSIMHELVYSIIDDRYRTKLPIIITTNVTVNDLFYTTDEFKQRIYSRLFEMCDFVEVKGKDRRKINYYSERNKIRLVKE